MSKDLDIIYQYVGESDFRKGRYYPSHYVDYNESYKEGNVAVHEFSVESETTYDIYNVEIRTRKFDILDSSCTCLQFASKNMCKHIAACLILHSEDIFLTDPEEKKLYVSKNILQEFYQPSLNGVRLKKQLHLTVELEFIENYSNSCVALKFKIGEDKLYSLNNRLNRFLQVYEDKKTIVPFGKNFNYDPNQYFFSKIDENILQYLVQLHHHNPYYNFQNLQLDVERLSLFLEVLKEKEFTITGYGVITSILKENPLKMNLLKEKDLYKLSVAEQDLDVLTDDYKYILKDHVLYEVPENISKIYATMQSNKIHELVFREEDLELFSHGLLPVIKNSVILDETVKDKVVVGVKPDVQIYLDMKEDIILCNLKFIYQGKEVDYFDSVSSLVRDDEVENEVLTLLLSYGFQIDKKIYMDELDIIGDFLEIHLTELAKTYEVFTSDKMKNTKIVKENRIQSSFSIGTDNIMSYQFDLGNIKNDEIVDVLESLKNKKKYYRLKSGDLLNLNQNDELKQLEGLVEEMDITNKDLKNGFGEIPKYRAIYLDSIKKEKYQIVKTNNLFDNLIQQFTSYKDRDVHLTTQEKKILRDYQEVGIQWLYNIYKCGFGGILADEMGLGKSIQLIYLIKKVILEKPDAKILIVAPTSLIYNWKNEFDKFGNELHYKVFAENKWIRKQELEGVSGINVFITTYGLIRQDREKYLEMEFEIIAIDEAQNIKNPNAQMTKVVKSLKANTKFALTGTPLENSVLELWSIFDFIMPGYLANQIAFQRKYNVKGVEEEELKPLESLNKQIRPFLLRRRKKDVVLELPPKIENNIYIDLNAEQKKLYVAQLEKTQKDMEKILAEEGFKKGNIKILQLLTKLRQLCIDPRILYENYQKGSAKIENLISLTKEIIENGHKILLFTSFKTALDLVNQEFTNHNISTYVIDGSVSSKKRMDLVNKFNEDDTNVFLITLKAGGTGLNLTSADVVIHLDLWWNPQVENQATDRAHRIGQKNTVEVIKLICKGTIEERILELQKKKKILSDTLIEGEDRDQNIFSKLTEKDIKHLLAIDNEED